MRELNIADIIKGCQRGDRKAQKALFENYAAALLTVSRQHVPESCDPMDNLQDSFLKIFKYIKSYDTTKGEIYTWMRKIVVNCAIDKLKEKHRMTIPFSPHQMTQNLNIVESTDKYEAEHLMHAISQLPEGYRQIFCMYEIEGYSHKEIGEIMDIGESTSRSYLSRSKEQLKKMLSALQNSGSTNSHYEILQPKPNLK